jgi:hypothetical protein
LPGASVSSWELIRARALMVLPGNNLLRHFLSKGDALRAYRRAFGLPSCIVCCLNMLRFLKLESSAKVTQERT